MNFLERAQAVWILYGRNLRVNKIIHLESGAFFNMSQLQTLYVSSNSKKANLTLLFRDLSQNSVEAIGVEGFSHLPNLSSLYAKLVLGTFNYSKQFLCRDISSNNLKTLTKSMLVSVGNCKYGFFTL